MLAVTSAEMRELDRLAIEVHGIPGHVLMERAGTGAAALFWKQFPRVRRHPVVIAGKGNNGGDGFVVARHLLRRGVRCDVVLLARAAEVHDDAARNLRAFTRARGRLLEAPGVEGVGIVRAALEGKQAVIDAILGTGLNAEVRGPLAEVIALLNASGLPVFAIDIPSGLDADRGIPLGIAVQAEATATFGFPKIGQLLYPGADHVGALGIVDIGIPREAVATVAPRTWLLEAAAAGAMLPRRRRDSHKGDAGHLLIVAGGQGKCGAATLAARGGLRAGAGLTTLALPAGVSHGGVPTPAEVMTATLPAASDGLYATPSAQELAALLAGKASVVTGPGIGVGTGTRALVGQLVETCACPLVLDADALNCIAEDPALLQRRNGPTVLTPHPGEMGRLIERSASDVQAARLESARQLADETGACVVLKGARTVVADPDGFTLINPTGNPGMASGGMGDALAGVIGALCAQGLSAADAAALGVYVHGLAADLAAAALGGEIGLTASDVIDALPRAIARAQAAATDDPVAAPAPRAARARTRQKRGGSTRRRAAR
jgi:NAD(P)H-hydrate epimerase